jgi:hypothetical protein
VPLGVFSFQYSFLVHDGSRHRLIQGKKSKFAVEAFLYVTPNNIEFESQVVKTTPTPITTHPNENTFIFCCSHLNLVFCSTKVPI